MKNLEEAPEGVETRYADHGEQVHEVLTIINEQLKPFLLEIVMIDEGSSSCYGWFIQEVSKAR